MAGGRARGASEPGRQLGNQAPTRTSPGPGPSAALDRDPGSDGTGPGDLRIRRPVTVCEGCCVRLGTRPQARPSRPQRRAAGPPARQHNRIRRPPVAHPGRRGPPVQVALRGVRPGARGVCSLPVPRARPGPRLDSLSSRLRARAEVTLYSGDSEGVRPRAARARAGQCGFPARVV
jgi:hypothetical protein